MEKLISMTDFVLKDRGHINHIDSFLLCCNYARFLKRPLTLGMFVPCDEEGNILKKPKLPNEPWECISIPLSDRYKKYEEARIRVLFKVKFSHSFEHGGNTFVVLAHDQDIMLTDCLVENLVSLELTLTESAQKQLGL